MSPAVKSPFLYQDRHWLVVDKPTGLSTHTPRHGELGLAEWLRLHHGLEVHICSRLDKGTSGVLVFALNPEASSRAEDIHSRDQARKIYYFISDREPPQGGKLDLPAEPRRQALFHRIYNRPQRETA